VTSLRARLAAWRQDKILRRVMSNSSYLFASNAISAVVSIFAATLLGLRDFGVLTVIMNFVANVNRLLSFRMSDVVVRYMGEALERGDNDRAAAIVKAAGLLEAVTSVVAFGVLVLVAPLGARYNAKDVTTTALFLLFGTSILANITTETATGILRVTNHFGSQALITLLQSIVQAGLFFFAALRGGGLVEILWAYLAGKMVVGLGPILVALYWLPRQVRRDWWRASFRSMPPWKEFTRFALSTNFSGTINVLARDSEVQWVSYFFNPAIAGLYKVALSLITFITMPIDAMIGPTYPEITRAYASRQWAHLKSLLKRVTVIAFAWTAVVMAGLLLFGRQVLFSYWQFFGHTFHIYTPEFAPAFPILVILLIGYGFGNLFYWNRSLLLSQGKADYVLMVAFFCMLFKVVAAILILPHAPYIAEAIILISYFIVSISILTWRGLREVRMQSALPEPQ
jgi:O-antigen/teichoic acid export membrane protein